jgi:hypothetical protein
MYVQDIKKKFKAFAFQLLGHLCRDPTYDWGEQTRLEYADSGGDQRR